MEQKKEKLQRMILTGTSHDLHPNFSHQKFLSDRIVSISAIKLAYFTRSVHEKDVSIGIFRRLNLE